MLSKRDVHRIHSQLEELSGPTVSLYVPPEIAGASRPRGSACRHALKSLGVPADIMSKVLTALDEAPVAPRTIAIFGNAGGVQAHVISGVPLLIDPHRVTVKWGQPYVGPLILTLEQSPRIGALYADGGQVRLCEIFLGEIDEILTAERATTPLSEGGEEVQQSKQVFPDYIPARGGAAKDLAADHDEEWKRKFYREISEDIGRTLSDRGIEDLVLLGPEADRPLYLSVISNPHRAQVTVEGPSLTTPSAPVNEILERTIELMKPILDQRRDELIARASDGGVTGLSPSLQEMQCGRLASLVVDPRLEETTVFVDPNSGYVATEPSDSTSDGSLAKAELGDVLPELARRYDVELVVLERDGRDGALAGADHIAGLRRW